MESVLWLTLLMLSAFSAGSQVSTATAVPWFWQIDSPSRIEALLKNGYRIESLDLYSSQPLRLSVLFVQNTNASELRWWWLYNVDADKLLERLTISKVRIVDLVPYVIGGKLLFSVLLVPNSGTDKKEWWYYYDASAAFIQKKLYDHKARLIDLDRYRSTNGTEKYSAVMVRNSGSDNPQWWWYDNVSPSFISERLLDHPVQLVKIAPAGSGNFSVITEESSLSSFWLYNQTRSSIRFKAKQEAVRLVQAVPYSENGKELWAGIAVSNANELTLKLLELMTPLRQDGAFGFYMREIGGPVYAELQQDYIYEPASSIKSLHLAHSLKQVAKGVDRLTSKIEVFTDLDYTCPLDSGGPDIRSLEDSLRLMMTVSSNPDTEAMVKRYGVNKINQSARKLGMINALIRHRIGCVSGEIGQIANPNRLTLLDITSLYTSVATTWLEGTLREKFFDIMLDYIQLNAVIDEEANEIELSSSGKKQFEEYVLSKEKCGFYYIFTSEWRYYQTVGGYVRLPFKSCDGKIRVREYVLGAFIDRSTKEPEKNIILRVGAETMRDEVSKALNSFLPCTK